MRHSASMSVKSSVLTIKDIHVVPNIVLTNSSLFTQSSLYCLCTKTYVFLITWLYSEDILRGRALGLLSWVNIWKKVVKTGPHYRHCSKTVYLGFRRARATRAQSFQLCCWRQPASQPWRHLASWRQQTLRPPRRWVLAGRKCLVDLAGRPSVGGRQFARGGVHSAGHTAHRNTVFATGNLCCEYWTQLVGSLLIGIDNFCNSVLL